MAALGAGAVFFEDRTRTRSEPAAPVVRRAVEAARGLGLKPVTRVVDGGLDANYLNARGLPTVTLGAGQHGAHTLDEYVDIDEFLQGCRLVLALAV